MKTPLAVLVVAILSVAAAAASARPAAVVHGAAASNMDHELTEAAAKRGFGGAVVAMVKGEVVLSAGYGLANRETGLPFTVDTPAQIGSITKTFTGLAVSQLIAEGKLDPKTPIREYLPDAAEPAASATLNQLLTHTAGLSDYCGDDFAPRTRAELLSVCMARPLEFERGSSHYSNMGVCFAAAVIEQVKGKPWEEQLRERIWAPFGMKDTGWTFPGRSSASFAVGYLADKSQGVISDRIAALRGADWHLKGNGGMQASAADMLRFYRGLMSQPEAVRAIELASHADGESPDVKEGYGLFFRLDASGKPYRIGHSGSDGVFFSYFAIYPQQDAFLYFVGNNGEGAAKAELQKVLGLFQRSLGILPPPPKPLS
jgi:CubicO group peptidase (beta-lactamase class C family)